MSTSRTQTTTLSSTAGPSGFRQIPITPAQPASLEDEDLDEDEEEIIRKAEEKAEEEAARKAKEEERAQAAAREERRKRMAEAATARSRRDTSTGEVSSSPRRPIVEIRKIRGKGKERVQAEVPAGGDPDDGGDEEEDDEDDRAPCEWCRTKKISCQMQAGKRSSIICKPCHDAKVKCSYSGCPSIVKKEVGANLTGERLAILESQVAQLLADNRQLRDGQVKANTYHRHFNRKLDWLITDAARRRRSPPEMPEAGPSGLSRKRRRVVDSDEEEEKEMEKDGEGEEEMEEEETAPTKGRGEQWSRV
ncbi:hypothetical protein EV368DRAFT_89775 [Lentinula lateritia]|nr:hypothetical protein EV368DRAFT_89775 [Lentinula lateritia]